MVAPRTTCESFRAIVPIPPTTRAAACVGIVIAKFDVDELELVPDVLLDDDPVLNDPV